MNTKYPTIQRGASKNLLTTQSNNPTIQQSNNPTIQPSKNPTIQQSNNPKIQPPNYVIEKSDNLKIGKSTLLLKLLKQNRSNMTSKTESITHTIRHFFWYCFPHWEQEIVFKIRFNFLRIDCWWNHSFFQG